MPATTAAEVWVPVAAGQVVRAPDRARFLRSEGAYAVYRTGAGSFTFTAGSR